MEAAAYLSLACCTEALFTAQTMARLGGESPVRTAQPDAVSFSHPALACPHPDLPVAGEPIGRLGTLDVRLASSASEIEAAQELRYRVFIEEMSARQPVSAAEQRLEADHYDEFCDHLIVLDTSLPGPDHRRVVGTYRLLPQHRAARAGGFYSQAEFDIAALIARHPGKRFLELGRSCVLPAYRGKRTVEALWAGIWAYVGRHGIDVLAGCASFRGTVPAAHAQALSYLAQSFRAEPEWDVRALAGRYAPMDLMPAEAIDAKAAFCALPTLIKGYLRVGARVGEGCVIDRDFGTVDVFVVLPISAIGSRYIHHYGRA